ncbi:FKBP-type peptidyl-prolyl cis-trans isomerase [Geomonas sp. RF6]|uniref:FKBP-type peptidyl-prolyl cis-trans isomerase n=1 Tax=Geomonas sp. RF6 TaxID=2897342 RepID=UPI001E5E1EC9|nr:FKBP-type peptidyl-prolyl cis-trans isomerase [Geomonas sp. RF6]UFS71334.1 FKBP-type peptidyl-prolyl cis-trans isomerase [Geomonas sp. RF6]
MICIALVLIMSTSAFAATEPKTEEQKTFYALGALISRSLAVFELTPSEYDLVQQGLKDSIVDKKAQFDPAPYTEKLQALAQSRRKAAGEKQSAAGKEYLAKAAKEKGAVKTESGLVYIPIKEGNGPSPKATDTVKVNYRGTLIDGKEFDSSYKRGTPAEFPLNGVIKCWTEGVQKMKVGGKAKLVCPPDLAYGDAGAGEMILPGSTLAFEVELLEVKGAAAPSAPSK